MVPRNRGGGKCTPWPEVERRGLRVDPSRTALPYVGTKHSNYKWFVPKNGTGVLKGLRHKQRGHTQTKKRVETWR